MAKSILLQLSRQRSLTSILARKMADRIIYSMIVLLGLIIILLIINAPPHFLDGTLVYEGF
jgi:hypothetical protein